MDNSETAEPIPPCNIDIKRPDKTYITAWKDKSEFQSVYDKIFRSAADDIASKEDAAQWLHVWKVRQTRDIPICIRCTLEILEAQLFDLRSQRDGRENATETKNIYAGAFTRFVNFLTEGPQNFRWRKKSIAEHVREIGIETYLVELRHLAAHRSVSVSIDVFRRSAQYCMDWLKASYWERELAIMQPVSIFSIKSQQLLAAKQPELTEILRTYNAATGGLAMGATTLAEAKQYLKPAELKLLQEIEAKLLQNTAMRMVKHLDRTLAQPGTSVNVNLLCSGLFEHCTYLFPSAVKPPPNGERAKIEPKQRPAMPLASVHRGLFRYLAKSGCLQRFFERLIAICEDECESDVRRSDAQYWAHTIAVDFQLLAQFKKECKSLPADQLVRFGGRSKKLYDVAFGWARRTLRRNINNHLLLGLTVDCPWHLRVSYIDLCNRLMAVNRYTKDIIPVLLSLARPSLNPAQQKQIVLLMRAYIDPEDGLVVRATPMRPANNGDSAERLNGSARPKEYYTVEDFVQATTGRKRPAKETADGESGSKKAKQRYGPWAVSQDAVAWESCPFGTCHVSVTN